MAWLAHPVTVFALVLLLVNDHYLKATHPGWWTGKLSDAAGLVLAPPLLAVLVTPVVPRCGVRRVALGATVTVGVGFATIKTFGYAAATASTAWSLFTPSLVRADRTDLLALPCLFVAWQVFRHAGGEPSGRVWRAARVAVLLPAALFGVAATSATPSPSAELVESADGAVYVGSRSSYPRDEPDWSVSRDGGRTWVTASAPPGFVPDPPRPAPSGPAPASPGPVSPGPTRSALASVPAGSAPAGSAPMSSAPSVGERDQSCSRARPAICYRLVPDALAVQASTDGGRTWTDSWRVPADRRLALYREYGDIYGMSTQLSGRSLAVHDLPAGGHVVVVANARDGFAVRDTGGAWSRIGFPAYPGEAVPDIDGIGYHQSQGMPFVIMLALVLGTLVITAGSVLARVRAGGRARLAWMVLPTALVGPPVLLITGLARDDQTSALVNIPGLFLTGLAALATVLVVVPVAARQVAHPGRWFARLAATSALALGGYAVVTAIWFRTGAQSLPPLLFGAMVVASAALGGMFLAGRAAGPWVDESEPPYPPTPVPGPDQMIGSPSPSGTDGRWPSKSTAE